ncbi:MAG: DUF1349 domain-containing protein [Methylacidiphilales bacterium]|nr:DUF1349 domain-containing protein [Candidatus Methylacidiphilales bacterium]
MRNAGLICGLLLGLSVATLKAGTLVNLADGSEVDGKLSLNPEGVHVEDSSGSDINLSDILQADFSNDPFHIDYFSSIGDTSSPLPVNWTTQEIKKMGTPGSVSYANGVFTLTGDKWDHLPAAGDDQTDHCVVVGRSWTGDGQWTFRVKSIDADAGTSVGGLVLRDSLDSFSADVGLIVSNLNSATMFSRKADHNTWSNDLPVANLPAWFRITRRGPSIDFELSSDGKLWNLGGFTTLPLKDAIWAGFFVNGQLSKTAPKISFDQVTFTPPPGPSPGRIVPTGVLLRSGSLVAGHFDLFEFTGLDPSGKFVRNEKFSNVSIPASQIWAAVYHPLRPSQLTALGSQVGILMKTGEFVAGSYKLFNIEGVHFDSPLLGAVTYKPEAIGACLFNPEQSQPANFEVRLKDGSCIFANSLSVSNGQIAIDDASGVNVPVDPEEIAQFRAGPAVVQNLLDLPWKANPPPAPAPPANPGAAPAANPPPATGPNPAVQCWIGKNQEQILATPIDTVVNFPLNDQFRTVAMSVALSPGSPPNSSAILQIMADGRLVGRTPLLKAGDQPRFVEFSVSDPKTLAVVADSMVAGTSVLVIDPVAIRDSPPSSP